MNRRWIRRSSYLDPQIWSRLPEDVLFMILACLPIRSLLKLRCVSRYWNKLLTSTVFITSQIKVTSQLPWILLFKCHNYRTLKAFDRSSNKWHNVSLSFLPTYATDLAASSAGLLCFRTLYSGQFVVCNPVSRSWKRLPPMSCSDSRGIVTLLTSTNMNDMNMFQVIVAAAEGDDFKQVTEIYSSVSNSWKIISNMPSFSLRPETACCNGKLYFTTCSEPPLIFSLDLERETWRQFQAPLPDSLTYCLPVASGGQLHLVGGLGRYGIAKRMSIWRLVDEGENDHWKEVYRMPDAECTKFAMNCYHNYEQISCTSQRDLICLSCSTWPQALVFCVPSCSWIWLPHCEQIPLRTSRGFKWFSLEPNLKQISL